MSLSQISVREISAKEPYAMRELLAVFARAFEDDAHYSNNQPNDDYLKTLLARSDFVVVVALDKKKIVGGLTAYELRKYEQANSELYLYDLAVSESHRRKGIATQLINALRKIAANRGCSTVFVQADREDQHAIALYSSLGEKADVVHFDFEPTPQAEPVLLIQ